MSHHHHHFGNGRRSINEEATEALKRIHTLKSLLPPKVVPNKYAESFGFMVHSRFNSHAEVVDDDDQSTTPIQREKAAKALENDDNSVQEAKSVHSVESAHNNSDKNRRYALSLATLAAKPSKRIAIVNEGQRKKVFVVAC